MQIKEIKYYAKNIPYNWKKLREMWTFSVAKMKKLP